MNCILLITTTIMPAHAHLLLLPLLLLLSPLPTLAKQPHVLFTCLPWPSHIDGLRALASTLTDRGFAVSFAIPQTHAAALSTADFQVLPLPSSTQHTRRRPLFELLPSASVDRLALSATHAHTQELARVLALHLRRMYEPLLEATERSQPDLMVVDRYTLAGFDVAQQLGIPFIVSNAQLLMGIDGHWGGTLPAPFESSDELVYAGGLTTTAQTAVNSLLAQTAAQGVLERCWRLFDGMVYRIAMRDASLEHIAPVRAELGLPPVPPSLTDAVVLTSSVFGIETPRALPPNLAMVGSLLPRKLSPRSLPSHLSSFLDSCDRHVVVVHLSPALLPAFSPEALSAQLRALSEHAYMVLMLPPDADDAFITAAPPSCFRGTVDRESLPALLSHSKVRLYFGEADLPVLQASLALGVRVVGVPVHGEQRAVMARIAAASGGVGIAPQLLRSPAHAELVAARTVAVLESDQYTAGVARLADIIGAAGGVAKAASFVQLVQEVGDEHLFPTRAASWLERTGLDNFALYAVAFLIITAGSQLLWSNSNATQ